MSRNLRLVAIVDDEPDITTLFKDALNNISNISIFTFTDPIMALEHFTVNKDDYALIVSDLRMPGHDGMGLLKRVKSINRYTRTILMTAFDINDAMFKDYSKMEIINGFLQKPIPLKDLRAKVNEELHLYELGIQKSIVANNIK